MLNEDTHILPTVDIRAISSATFHSYLLQYRLTIGQVARVAGLPQIIIWSVERGNPISPAHEGAVRAGLHRLTGVPYSAPIAVCSKRIIEGKHS